MFIPWLPIAIDFEHWTFTFPVTSEDFNVLNEKSCYLKLGLFLFLIEYICSSSETLPGLRQTLKYHSLNFEYWVYVSLLTAEILLSVSIDRISVLPMLCVRPEMGYILNQCFVFDMVFEYSLIKNLQLNPSGNLFSLILLYRVS
jgi:hypothetical protein